ncbi:hypothetical protein [Kineosporia babensis]|uniref:Uncharacterized protein n=1 Tax=Kineosporia babensis TaxID=499548 RepID=A0A9X1NBX3_9ACTN|nr:hypothetical protein [Kineosporia babensis]MCD5310461.1 hypothetical protein [Kineosporia babensis]
MNEDQPSYIITDNARSNFRSEGVKESEVVSALAWSRRLSLALGEDVTAVLARSHSGSMLYVLLEEVESVWPIAWTVLAARKMMPVEENRFKRYVEDD